MNITEVQEVVSDWVRSVLVGVPVYWSRENFTGLTYPYINLLLLHTAPSGMPFYSPPQSDGSREVRRNKEATISITFNSSGDENPHERLEALVDSLELSRYASFFRTSGVNVWPEEIKDASKIFEVENEKKASVLVVINYITEVTDPGVGVVESVGITGVVVHPDKEVPITVM